MDKFCTTLEERYVSEDIKTELTLGEYSVMAKLAAYIHNRGLTKYKQKMPS